MGVEVKEGMKIGERMECVLNALFEVVVGKKCVCLGGGKAILATKIIRHIPKLHVRCLRLSDYENMEEGMEQP